MLLKKRHKTHKSDVVHAIEIFILFVQLEEFVYIHAQRIVGISSTMDLKIGANFHFM